MIRTLLFLSVIGLAAAPMAARAADRAAVVATYAELVHASYADSLALAKQLQADIKTFVAKPDAASLEAAKKAWLAAREPYGRTEAYRFYAGPIDDDDGPEGLLNAWPLDENYIDYTKDGPDAGIIADAKQFPEITAALLRELNEKDGDANISTGYHAIEFLLWGQDLSADGPGARPVTDYTTHKLADRRKQYLVVVTDMLIADLATLVTAWKPGADNYRKGFEADVEGSLGKIIVGIGSLGGGELAGERMAVALENKDQEDEHSCFSDNTHRDIATNAEGIANVWAGTYIGIDGSKVAGASLRDLVVAKDKALADKVDAALAGSSGAIAAMRVPFDQEIIKEDGRKRVQTAIDALWVQTRLMPEVAKVVGVEAAIEGL